MIPVKLTLQGIYSYQSTPQTIEFGPLLDAGNFGIFGAVGSGKSTILEAISLALYGDIERLNKKDNRNYNMMNLKSDRLSIEFEFRNYDGELFRFECTGRRNSKQFTEVPTYRRKASVWKDTSWIALDHADGEMVTGISYQNFKRTVIVPQGHFQDFLGLTPSDRSKMLQELFHLDQYDLAGPTKKLREENSEGLYRIQGQLVGYEEDTEERIELAETELKRLQEQVRNDTGTLDSLRNQVETSTALKQLFDQKREQKNAYQNLKQYEDEIRLTQRRVKLVQEAREKFSFRFSQIDALRKSIDQLDQHLKELKQKEELVRKRKVEVDEQHQRLQLAVGKHEEEKEKSRQYELAARWSLLNKDYLDKQIRVRNGMEVVRQLQKQIVEKNKEIADIEKELESKTVKTQDREILLQLKNAFTRMKDLGEQISKIRARQRQADQKIAAEKEQFCRKYQIKPEEPDGLPDLSKMKSRLDELKRELKDHRQLLNQLHVQAELGRYVESLSPGESCPLCGSLEHPAPAHIESVQGQIESISVRIRQWEQEEKALETGQVEWQNLNKNVQQRAEHRRQESAEIEELESSRKEIGDFLTPHSQKYPDLSIVLAELEETNLLMNSIRKSEAQVKDLRRQVQEESDKHEKYRGKIDEISNTVQKMTGELDSLKSQLTPEIGSELESRPSSEWKQRSTEIAEKMDKEKVEYRRISEERDQISQEYTQLKTTIEGSISYQEKETTALTDVEQILDQVLIQSSFDSVDEVRHILKQEIDVEKEQQRIAKYDRDIHVLEVAIKDLDGRIGDRQFDQKLHEDLTERYVTKEKELGQLREQTAYQSKRIAESRIRLKRKKELEQECNALELRAENLKVLEGLFKGKKFVDFVSTVYLREICEIANRRFRKLTNNHFALVLSEDNQFNVRDYLHDGQIRSVKTLSGGQVFQVSLCLALALAESIQNRNQSRQNFFFLDEGFGTLDGDALRLVMETLKSLRQEGRVVGLISHVESLQQEMDVHLHIVNDPEKGSQVRKSY